MEEENFEFLTLHYHDRSAAKTISDAFGHTDRASMPSDQERRLLAELIREFNPESIEDLRQRSWGTLMFFYGIIELGCLCGCLSSSMPVTFSRIAINVLERSELNQYRGRFPLVVSLANRLSTPADDIRPPWSNLTESLFRRFLVTSSPFLDSLELIVALQMMDGHRVSGYAFSDVLPILSDPGALVKSLRVSSESRFYGPLHMALRGFRKYIIFCSDFHQLLEDSADFPPIRMAFWKFHARWLGECGPRVRDSVGSALSCLESWQNISSRRSISSHRQVSAVAAHILRAAGRPTIARLLQRLERTRAAMSNGEGRHSTDVPEYRAGPLHRYRLDAKVTADGLDTLTSGVIALLDIIEGFGRSIPLSVPEDMIVESRESIQRMRQVVAALMSNRFHSPPSMTPLHVYA